MGFTNWGFEAADSLTAEQNNEAQKREILAYCNAHPDDDWDTIARRFGVDRTVVSGLFIGAMF